MFADGVRGPAVAAIQDGLHSVSGELCKIEISILVMCCVRNEHLRDWVLSPGSRTKSMGSQLIVGVQGIVQRYDGPALQ